jgi:O-methyltransferase domain
MSQTESHGPSPEHQLMQMTMGTFVSRMLTLVANLGVADHMDGPTEIDKLAVATETNAAALYRVMRALSAVGIFAESAGRMFALTPLGDALRADHPRSLRSLCQMVNEPWTWVPWGVLDHSVKTGQPAFDQVFGMSMFEYFEQHPDQSKRFGDAMTSMTLFASAAITSAYDFSPIKHLVDVGGSHGILLSNIIDKFPTVRGTVFDQPHVVEEARALLVSDLHRERIALVSGDFFEALPSADGYIIKSVLHDWDDASCAKILGNCRAAMEPDGRVLIVEGLVTDSPESVFAKLLDIQMLVVTQGGRERTAAEFGSILRTAGLALTRVVSTHSPFSVIEARAA